MHDLGRTQLETNEWAGEFHEDEYAGEFHEDEWAGEFQEDEYAGELYEDEFAGEFQEDEFGEVFGEVGELSEAQEMALAAELLEISNEQELEQFLGKLIKGAAKAAGGFIRSPVGRMLGGALKDVARKALPMVGGALGSMVAPGVGTALGSKLGSMAAGLFEVELSEMSNEQAEFEVARRVVNLAATAARRASAAPPTVAPAAVVRSALATAARAHAPGLARAMTNPASPIGRRLTRPPYRPRRPYRPRPASAAYAAAGIPPSAAYADDGIPYSAAGPTSYGYTTPSTGARSGRWYRRGNKLIVVGA